jgi:hypothetical protein
MNHVRTITHPLFFGIVVVAMFMMSFGQLALLFRMVAEIILNAKVRTILATGGGLH